MLYIYITHRIYFVVYIYVSIFAGTNSINMLRIEELMKSKKVGVTELADRLKVNRQTIYYYIKQDDKNSIAQLQKIADALKVPLSDILEHKESPKSDNSIICPKCGTKFKMEE